MIAKDIIKIIEEQFPPVNAEDWDNVGLLIGNYDKEVKKIQFSIDATLEAIDNAIENKIDMIITHHPIIFKAIKNINNNTVIGRKILKLIKNDINVYCIHTNLDSTLGGLNDYILNKLGIENSQILDLDKETKSGIGRVYKLKDEIFLKQYLDILKEKLGLKNIRIISKNKDRKIKKIALINGSAMSYWKLANSIKVDLFITGDITYHDALDAKESGMNVIDFGHYESEHFFYELLKFYLEKFNLEFNVFNDGPVFEIY